MKCYIVKDLLPNYIDGMTGEEASNEIKEHLVTCDDCRNIYIQMSADIPCENAADDKNIDFLKKIRRSGRRKNLLIILSVCMVLAVLGIFAKNYHVALPFAPENMQVEIHQAVALTYESGYTQWTDLDYLGFEQTRDIIENPDDYEIIDVAEVVCENMPRGSLNFVSRSIQRNDKNVNVIYFCYTETLWDYLFFDMERKGASSEIRPFVSLEHGSMYEKDYKPCLKEIYYLPIRDLDHARNLSNEEFDALRENATLVWSGMI